MCYQLTERYAVCGDLYYRHAIDPCQLWGKKGHAVIEKTVRVGFSCPQHAPREPNTFSQQVVRRRIPETPLSYHRLSNAIGDPGTSDSESDSVVNTEGSITNSTSTAPTDISETALEAAATYLTDLLLEQQDLFSLFEEAVASSSIGPDRFERAMKILLVRYSADLQIEARETNQKMAAAVVKVRARYIARHIRLALHPADPSHTYDNLHQSPTDRQLVLERYFHGIKGMESESPDPQGRNLRNELADEDNDPEDNETDIAVDMTNLKKTEAFLLNSTAFQVLTTDLFTFVRPSFDAGIRHLSRKTLDPMSGTEDLRLKNRLADLRLANPKSIRISYKADLRIADQIKNYVERMTRETWDWWPLARPFTSLPEGYGRLYWDCV